MRKILGLVAALGLALGIAGDADAQQKQIRVGFFPGPYADQFKRGVQPVLEKQGYRVTVTEFSNAVQPNSAVMDGSLDVNIFQNRAFMEVFNGRNSGDLAEALRIPSAPLGLYSKKVKDVAALPAGASISLPNDPTSMARALQFLEKLGLVKMDPAIEVGKLTEKNVAANPKNLKLTPLDAPQIPRALPDVDAGLALGNHIIAAGMLLSEALALEDPAPQFQIIIAARKGALDSPWMQDLVAAYKSAEFRSFVETDPKTKGFSKPEYWR